MTPPPHRIPLADEPPSAERCRDVDAVLRAGGLAALPTETVYGLAARADAPEALDALRRLKGRPRSEPLTWHVGSPGALGAFPRVSPVVARLAERYWPGPLTLVLPGVPAGLGAVSSGGWTAIRLPAHQGTAGLLETLAYPIVITSANRHGEPPMTDAAAVAAAFGDHLGLVADGGPSRMGEPSGVLRVGEGRFELLREGLLPLADLRRTAGLRLAFACTGNTCRSPLAEGLALRLLSERLGVPATRAGLARFGFSVRSFGVWASPGAPAAEPALRILAEHGIDLGGHRSAPAVPEELVEDDRIYCSTHAHLEALVHLLPPSRGGRVHMLDPRGVDIPDPIGGDLERYRTCTEELLSALRRRLDEWA